MRDLLLLSPCHHPTSTEGERLDINILDTYSSDSLDLPWKNSVRELLQLWDNGNIKANIGTQDSLRTHGCCNPCWVQEERLRGGLRVMEVKHLGYILKEEEKQTGRVNGIGQGGGQGVEEQQQEKQPVNGNGKHTTFQNGVREAINIVAWLKSCAKNKDLCQGTEVHSHIAEKGLLKTNVFVGNTLVYMYAKCGVLEKAQEVFDELPVRTIVSWNALITGYAQHGFLEEALCCLEQMQVEGFSPNVITFASILNICGTMEATQKGQEVHAQIVERGLLAEEGIIMGTAVVDMYAKCGMLLDARDVFDKLPVRDLVAWTTLIAGYAKHGYGDKAMECLEGIQSEGYSPNAITISCILKACSSINALHTGQELHARITGEGLLEDDPVLANGLIDMYAKNGLLREAQEVFNELRVHNVFSWTSLITGYARFEYGEKALKCYKGMRHEGFLPDAVTYSGILKACSSIGAAYAGQTIHMEIVSDGFLECNRGICTALVDMYTNCAMLAEAEYMFDKMPCRDVMSWTSLMEGYAQLGNGEIVFNSLHEMIEEGEEPNMVTFTVILNACCHGGLVDKGQVSFEMVSQDYDIIPTIKHHTCLVHLLGRAGQLDGALAVIEEMSFSASLMVWHTLQSACQNCGYVELGGWAFKQVREMDWKDIATHVGKAISWYTDAD